MKNLEVICSKSIVLDTKKKKKSPQTKSPEVLRSAGTYVSLTTSCGRYQQDSACGRINSW